MFIKFFLVACIFLSVSNHIFAQEEGGRYDSIRIKLNTHVSRPNIFSTVVKTITLYHQNNPELFYEYKCIRSSRSNVRIKITLNSGTLWDLDNPPKEPIFFLFRFLIIKSTNKNVTDRFHYVKFLSICEAIDDIAYDMIDKINVYWDHWNVDITETITLQDFDNNAEGIINKGGTKCVSIEYEILSNLNEGFKIVRSEVTYP